MLEEKRWILSESIPIPNDFRAAIGGHPLVAETLFRRGFKDIKSGQAFLDPDAYKPCSPDELPDSQIEIINTFWFGATLMLMDKLPRQFLFKVCASLAGKLATIFQSEQKNLTESLLMY